MKEVTEILSRVDAWSKLMKENGMSAIEQILKDCGGNEQILKAVLTVIMVVNPELIELVNTYYSIASLEEVNDDDYFDKLFGHVRAYIGKKVEDIHAMLASGKNHQGLTALAELGQSMQQYAQVQLVFIDHSTSNDLRCIYDAVANTKNSLDLLQQQIGTKDQDRILEGLIGFKKAIASLENHVQELIVNKL